MIRRDLQSPPDYPVSHATEKGIDVAIVDMIRLGASGYLDTAILFSSDNNLMPAIEVLWTMQQCGHVEVASWSCAHRSGSPAYSSPVSPPERDRPRVARRRHRCRVFAHTVPR